ncbi:DUF3300 domain-containing protein [Colwellia hornerae]|uniref:DUF3300 domain-containing protein n=1 Tax=Colwellia hornerae TaxID=89402 RepID=A0A5C6Q639_9GAMM|nr:DUF3300 domain-containing protein [Colwellia hornerae]TWX48833.1 DUF3300 domain-containing protein [Colwellia hornerae]TWX55333.1 DUF3300 domain-containing protein [Colwellia hornerae]TWX64404.1 DUF3300 domain-containing protein [Colwellia hornerae]
MKKVTLLFSFAALVSFNLFAEYQPSQSALQQQEQQLFSEAELAQMLAPIALYPDSLLTHILIAATYPIEIIEAHRWLTNNASLNTEQAAQAVQDFNWDASVKALVPFERILSRLSENLTWTQQLGDAFLQDESRVLENIQQLRKKAQLAGNLGKMDNMEVSYQDNNIVIEAREKEIVYVPYYDTRMVYGAWHWSSYPPVYWQPQRSGYVSRYNPFYWHAGVHISFDYFFSAFHWHNRQVVVVNTHRSPHRYYEQRPRHLIANGGYAKRWRHQPVHRKGVAYRNKHTRAKYNDKRVRVTESSKRNHYVIQNKLQQNAKRAVSVIKHKPNESVRRANPVTHKATKAFSKPVSKNYRSYDQSKKIKAEKVYRATKPVNKEKLKKVTTRVDKKSASQHTYKAADTSSRHKNNRSSDKHNKQRRVVKKNSSKAEKQHH